MIGREPLTDRPAGDFELWTTGGTFLVKPVDPPDPLNQEAPGDLALYRQVEEHLNHAGIKQAKLHRTIEGQLHSLTGHARYEFVPGKTVCQLSREQARSVTSYSARYNHCLLILTVPHHVRTQHNLWQTANLHDYLLYILRKQLASMALSDHFRGTVEAVLDFLDDARASYHALPKQFVHGDLVASRGAL